MSQSSINNEVSSFDINAGASGDARIVFDINENNEWGFGADDDDSDKFKISQGGILGVNDVLTITSSGDVRFPLTPSFQYYANDVLNVTGDNTTYTCVFANENFDQNSDFDSTSTFTAPIAGRYSFNIHISIRDLVSAMITGLIRLITSNRTYSSSDARPGPTRTASSGWSTNFSHFCDMDASDTATVTIRVAGGSKVVDFESISRITGNLEA